MTTFRCSLALGLALLPLTAVAQDLALPSGLPATLYDVVLERAGGETRAPDAFTDPESSATVAPEPAVGPLNGLARFRLLVPGLGSDGATYEIVAGDFAWLCETLAMPALAANGWTPSEVVIALSDREVAFGATDPEAVQYFEGFRVEAGACVPQAF